MCKAFKSLKKLHMLFSNYLVRWKCLKFILWIIILLRFNGIISCPEVMVISQSLHNAHLNIGFNFWRNTKIIMRLAWGYQISKVVSNWIKMLGSRDFSFLLGQVSKNTLPPFSIQLLRKHIPNYAFISRACARISRNIFTLSCTDWILWTALEFYSLLCSLF